MTLFIHNKTHYIYIFIKSIKQITKINILFLYINYCRYFIDIVGKVKKKIEVKKKRKARDSSKTLEIFVIGGKRRFAVIGCILM